MKSLLDFELLNTFSTVVAEGGFKGAAARLYRSQSTISMQIKRLEEQLEVCLLQRSNQGIKLTSEGKTLLAYAERFLRLNNEVLSALSTQPLRGEIHFGVPTDYAQAFVQHFIPRLKREFPELLPRVTCSRSRELREMIKRADLDIAIVTGEPEFDNEETLWTERLLWAVATSLRPQQQAPLPVALFEGDCVLRETCLDDLKQADIRYELVMTSPELENLTAAVTAGLAASLLPESSLANHLEELQPITGLPHNHVLSMNLIQATSLESTLLIPLKNCIRETARSVMG